MIFPDRRTAGAMLAEQLSKYAKRRNVIVLAIPRGGVVVGRVIADTLRVPLDIIVTKKIGAPGNPEYAIGALSPDGEIHLNPKEEANVSPHYLKEEIVRLTQAIRERERSLRGDKPFPSLEFKTVILADDGIATGYTTKAALSYTRRAKAQKVVLAVPVSSRDALSHLRPLADEVIVLHKPAYFEAVGQFYEHFPQVSDAEVRRLLARS